MDGLLNGKGSIFLDALIFATSYDIHERKPATGEANLNSLPQPRLGGIEPCAVNEAKTGQSLAHDWLWTVAWWHRGGQGSRDTIVSERNGIQGARGLGQTGGIDIGTDGKEEFWRVLGNSRHDVSGKWIAVGRVGNLLIYTVGTSEDLWQDDVIRG